MSDADIDRVLGAIGAFWPSGDGEQEAKSAPIRSGSG